MIREYNEILPMGNGYHSIGKMHELLQRLEEAFRVSSDLQQGVLVTSQEYKTDFKKMEIVVRDVAMALLGCEISIKKHPKA